MLRFSLAVVALCVAGCHWTLTDPGTDPKPAQLYFPTGIAMDPGGRYVYVSNGNADLAYGGGTLMIADMRRFECAVARWRQKQLGATPPAVCMLAPIEVKDSPEDKDVNAALCQPDPSFPTIVDCDETPFILKDSTVKIGNFAGEIRLQHTAGDDTHRKLYVAVRGDPSITWANVDLSQTNKLDCAAKRSGSPPGCDTNHLVQQYVCKDLPSCVAGLQNNGTTQLPTEPFGMQIDQGKLPDGRDYARLLVGHQGTGQVSLIDLTQARPNILFTSAAFFQPDNSGNRGVFGLAQQHKGRPDSDWYLTTNLFSQLNTFRIAEANVIVPEGQISLQATFAFGNDVRDIQFEPSGNRAFVTVNNPPSLLTLDTRVLPGPTGGRPQNLVATSLDVCQTPSHMGIRRSYVPGAPGEPPQLKTRIYVACFLSSQVMVVDPDLPDVLETIFAGIGGPNEIAFNFASVDAPDEEQVTPILPHRAYVANFSESTIAVLDLDPGSPTENHVIGRLGFPPAGIQK